MDQEPSCANCGKKPAKFSCSACKTAKYCCKECQVQHWKSGHKGQCKLQQLAINAISLKEEYSIPYEIRKENVPFESRKCFATRTIQLGEQIMCERAAACVPLQHLINKICIFCCGDLGEKKCFCPGCELAVCSQECLKSFSAYHQFECGVIKSLLVTATAVDVEFSLMMMAMRLLIAQKHSESRPSASPLTATLTVNAVSASNEEVQSLMDHREQMRKEEREGIREASRVLVTVFPPQITASAEEIHKLISICLVNCHATGYEDVASGLYPRISMIEHSCLPNAQITSILAPGSLPHLQVRAIRRIAPGEEITISYVDLMRSTAERQEQLMREKYFRCTCQRCQKSETDPMADFCLDVFLCTNCPNAKKNWIRPKSNTCPTCHKVYPPEYFAEITQRAIKDTTNAVTDPNAINRTLPALAIYLRPRVHANNTLLLRLHQVEVLMYSARRLHRAALQSARELLRVSALCEPKYCRSAFEWYKSVALNLFYSETTPSARTEVAQLVLEAELALNTVYGKDHPLVAQNMALLKFS